MKAVTGITVTGLMLNRCDSMQGLDVPLTNHFELLIMTLRKNSGSEFNRPTNGGD